ncbi:FAD-dependent oxidoreductase [Micromonospora ureilytica]|uniref:Glycine/D-amino acid oxidase-like deaminating enzyme n=1 Tax=Micromonospora ureilytica TaxID=709868 RepID=A0ABS0JCD8_9ACTN|nr:FAD-dependent oxidoreductase [Micromonospora ureilytica]MBG6064705.1 glycine/D-amino acid oxidase-like deaminating enzyme [Micromonospora ureilytica]
MSWPGSAASGWQRDDPRAARQPALSGDDEATVAIVGGGLAGLALAYQLTNHLPGSDILVLEATEVGSGASGHSTGIVGPGVGGPITTLVKRYGADRARTMFGATLDGIAALRRLARALPDGCELTDGFQLVAASAPAHSGSLRRQAQILRELGFDASYLGHDGTAERLGTARYHGALCYPDIALINPWLLVQSLRAALLAAGVRIAENTPVTGLTGGDPVTLTAGGHRVRARRVALTTDGFTTGLGLFTRNVAVIRTHVLRTASVPPHLLAESGWDGRGAAIDSRSFFNYLRLTARGQLLFGGGPALLEPRVDERGVAAVRARLVRELAATFPALADVPVTDFWSGVTASTFDRLPIVGPVPGQAGVWFAGAWCGHGLALSALTAELLAPRLAGVVGGVGPAPMPDLPWMRSTASLMPTGRIGNLLLAGYLRGLDAVDRLAPARRSARSTPPALAAPAEPTPVAPAAQLPAAAATELPTAPATGAAVAGSRPVEQQVDIVIVGARVAGSALAARLAAAGLSVALFDRGDLPTPTLSTHILHGTEDLRIEGVYDTVVALGVPPLHDVRVRLDDVELHFRHPDNPGLCPRREVLDQVLLDRASAAGAKTSTGTAVVGLRRGSDGTVSGVTVQHADGSVRDVSAQLVIGADGRNSSVARWVGARQYLTTRSERALLWRYFTGVRIPPALLWHRIGVHIVSILPTGPEDFVLIAQPPEHLQGELAGRDVAGFLRHVESVSPAVAELAAAARPVGSLNRVVRYPCFFRQPFGPGWVLVGDAGHAKDATLGHGINDALRSARGLAAVLTAHWGQPAALSSGLARWARDRDKTELANYWYGQDIGRGGAVTTMERAILAGIQRDSRAVGRLDDVMGDRLDADRLLTLPRLVGAVAHRVTSGEPASVVGREAVDLVQLAWARRRAATRHAPSAP